MKKLIIALLSAFIMSVTAFAQTQTATMQRIDLSKCKLVSKPKGLVVPKTIKTDLNTTKDCMFDAPDGHARAFGFNVFDYKYRTNAVVDFTTDNALDYQIKSDYGQVAKESIGFFCSTFVGDKIFAYCYLYYGPNALVPLSFGFIDPQTGDYTATVSFDIDSDPEKYFVILNDMCYDPGTKLVYASATLYKENGWPSGKSNIYTIDPFSSSYTLKLVAEQTGELYTLACDKGNLYSIVPVKSLDGASNKNSELIKMPINSLKDGAFEQSVVNEEGLGVKILWSQSMEFDKINHKLWWFGETQDDKSFFCDIDVNTGKINTRQDFATLSQVVALSIPYQDVNSKAPSYPRNMKAVRGENGKRTVDLTWNNPTLNYDLEELSSIKEVKIIRDDELVAKITANGAGIEQTHQDTNVPDGVHIYKILCTNEFGDGVYKEVKVFIGHDLPVGPGSVKIEVDKENNCKATISWIAPTIGMNGGWIDQTSLKYDILRYPDKVKIASDFTGCSITDVVEKSEGYYYEVTAKNNDGVGGTSTSNIVNFGPKQTIPFFSSLDTKEEFNKWTVIDNNNDLVTWKFGDNQKKVTNYDRSENAADDYLVSPELQFEEGKKYQVRFKYWTINWVNPDDHSPILEKMKVYYAQEPTTEAFQAEGPIIDLGEFHTPSETYLYAKQVFSVKPGKGHIAFHACSDPYRSIIYVQDVSVREYSKTDISVTDFMGSSIVVMNANETYNVEVTNEGSNAVSDYTVEIINSETGEVLGSAEGETIRAGQKIIIPTDWTPKATGTVNVSARVVLEGDTYPADNLWPESIETTINPEGSNRWLAINRDESYVDEIGNFYNKGWGLPFGELTECIYLDRQIPKKDITITGIAFVHDPLYEETMNPFTISAQATDKDFFSWDEVSETVDYIDEFDSNWITLFDGDAKLGDQKHNSRLEIKFTTPYKYEGGNICFLFSGYTGETVFHYEDIYDEGENERHRTCGLDKGGTYWWVPVTMFSYVEGDIDGIMGVSNDGMNFDIAEGMLTMSTICDVITVYDVDGKVVAEVRNSNLLSLGSLHGAYVIKAVSGSKVVNCKVNL